MYYRQGLLTKLDRKFGRYAIKNLMLIFVGAMAIVFIMNMAIYASTGQSLYSRLIFDRDAIFSGEFWRIFTFIFLPPNLSLIFIIFSLYLYYIIGSTLENQWGALGFNAFYLLGIIGSIIAGLIVGYATNYYINLSLFLAFALLNPNYQLYLFFFIPIEMKWLALLDIVLIAVDFYNSPWDIRASIIASLINILIFFTPHLIDHCKAFIRRIKWKNNFK